MTRFVLHHAVEVVGRPRVEVQRGVDLDITSLGGPVRGRKECSGERCCVVREFVAPEPNVAEPGITLRQAEGIEIVVRIGDKSDVDIGDGFPIGQCRGDRLLPNTRANLIIENRIEIVNTRSPKDTVWSDAVSDMRGVRPREAVKSVIHASHRRRQKPSILEGFQGDRFTDDPTTPAILGRPKRREDIIHPYTAPKSNKVLIDKHGNARPFNFPMGGLTRPRDLADTIPAMFQQASRSREREFSARNHRDHLAHESDLSKTWRHDPLP